MDAFPDTVTIALNSEGLHFLNEVRCCLPPPPTRLVALAFPSPQRLTDFLHPQDRETLSSFGYADIYRWGGSSTQFSIIIWNPDTQDTDDVAMFTSQAADMAALILDYINAIMATTSE